MSEFSSLWAAAQSDFYNIFGDDVLIEARSVDPRGDVNARSVADPNRRDQTIPAVFTHAGRREMMGPGRGVEDDYRIMPRKYDVPTFAVWASKLAWMPKRGDVVTYLTIGKKYRIEKTEDDPDGRVFLYVAPWS